MLRRCFVFILLAALFSNSCRSTPPPTVTVIPVPTFTPTSVAPAPTATTLPMSPQPTPQPMAQPTAGYEMVSLPASLYYLSMAGQIWQVDRVTREHRQLTAEAASISDFDVARRDGRLVYVTDNQLIEFDPATRKRVIKVAALAEAALWEVNENGARYCTRCDTDQILAPRYGPEGDRIAFAQGGINVIAGGFAGPATPQRLFANVRFQQDTNDVNAVRFYADSRWSPDGARLAVYAGAWEWAGYELYDFATGRLQMVRSLSVPGVHLCCIWEWGDPANGYMAAPRSHGPIPDTGLYQVNGATAEVRQLNSGAAADSATTQRGVRSAYQSATGELYAFIAVNDEQSPWQPILYTLHRLDLQGGTPTPLNQYQIPIEGEVLWAPDGSGAIVMTASFTQPGEPAKGKFAWLTTQDEYGALQPLQVRGSHLRWGPN